MKVVLLGTPDFAVPVLLALHKHHEVVAVVTQPDRPQGRKHTLVPPPVKVAAQALGLPVLQFEKIKREPAASELEALGAQVMVTAAYGQLLSQRNLEAAPLGVINAHASLLPKYRGAAPVNRCLMAGETVTGITMMHTDVGLDTGDMILQKSLHILPDETADELLARLAPLAAEATMEALALLETGTAPRLPQDESQASYQPLLTKEDGRLPFGKTAQQVCDHARGVTSWPGASGVLDSVVYRFDRVRPCEGQGVPGEVLVADDRQGLIVACGQGAVRMGMIQAPGKRMMDDTDYLRGHADLLGKRFDA